MGSKNGYVHYLVKEMYVAIDLKLLKQKDQEINDKNSSIKMLENLCLSKQRREKYPEKNVIYILSTEDRTYSWKS